MLAPLGDYNRSFSPGFLSAGWVVGETKTSLGASRTEH